METDFHNLPPDLEEAVKSTIKSSQGPISLAIDTATTGDSTTEGTKIVEFWESFDLQFEQEGSTSEVHRAFNTPLFNSNTSPGSINFPIEEISREESLRHTQREDEGKEWEVGEVNLKSKSQSITFTTPARFEEEVKVTLILLPSEENSDLWIAGGNEISSTPCTIKRSPRGYTTS
jgi:hypothetical protein